MLRYSITDDSKVLMASEHRRVQVAIATLANQNFETKDISGICKYEGGVKVNGREIAIQSDYVIDDFNKQFRSNTQEEAAVVAAINQIADAATSDHWVEWIAKFNPTIRTDPLRQMLGIK